MISPDSLSPHQKRYLRQRYRLDVDEKARFRRRDRFAIMFLWIGPLLAAGLLWDGTPRSPAFSAKPAEYAAWFLVAFLLIGRAIVFLADWSRVRRGPQGSQSSEFFWYTLLQHRIRPPIPAFVRWVGWASSLAIVLIAALTGRPILAAAWALAIAALHAHDRWEDRIVRRELEKIEARSLQPIPEG